MFEFAFFFLMFVSAVLLFFAIGDIIAILGIAAYDEIYTRFYIRKKRKFWRKVKRGQI